MRRQPQVQGGRVLAGRRDGRGEAGECGRIGAAGSTWGEAEPMRSVYVLRDTAGRFALARAVRAHVDLLGVVTFGDRGDAEAYRSDCGGQSFRVEAVGLNEVLDYARPRDELDVFDISRLPGGGFDVRLHPVSDVWPHATARTADLQ